MFSVKHKGNFDNTRKMMKKASSKQFQTKLNEWGEKGVEALRASTPIDTGETAESWDYRITKSASATSLVWVNNNTDDGYVSIAILLQYGHGTRNGGYVQGIDYVNPAMRPVFDQIAKEAWATIISK